MSVALGLFNYGLILIFGVLISLDFAGIQKTAKTRIAQICFIIAMLLVQTITWRFLGLETTKKIYPIIAHLPLALFLVFYFKCTWFKAFSSIFSAYLCCQTPRWIATVALYVFGSRAAYFIFYILSIFLVLYLLKKYVVSSVNRLMNISKSALLLFSAVPFMYYLFDYATTVYTDLLYDGIEMAVHFMPSVVSMFYFIFVIIYYNEMQRRSSAEQESILMTVQINQSKKEFATFQVLQEKTAIYRHDMRHHLALIEGYLADEDTQNAKEYIRCTQESIDNITSKRYCNNNTVNLILSSFEAKAKEVGVSLSISVNLPQSFNISEMELCVLLSNGIENAINASSKLDDEAFKTVRFNCQIHKGNLLIFIENSFSGKVIIENGFPQNKNQGHGFGVKSMAMIAQNHNGYCSFSEKDRVFTLKIVIPLGIS